MSADAEAAVPPAGRVLCLERQVSLATFGALHSPCDVPIDRHSHRRQADRWTRLPVDLLDNLHFEAWGKRHGGLLSGQMGLNTSRALAISAALTAGVDAAAARFR